MLKISSCQLLGSLTVLLLILLESQSASVKEILNLNAAEASRTPRETQYYGSRYNSPSTGQAITSRPIKPEETSDARERDSPNVEKRCARCDYYYRDSKYPSDYRGRYDDRYDDRYDNRYDDRYDDRSYRDRYDDRYRYYDDYDRRYYDSDRRYYDSDRKYNDYDRKYDDRDKYDRDRYYKRPDYYDRYNKYDRDRYDDRYKNYDRYDYRGYRPWDETTRGTSGFDSSGRGYYFAVGRPEYSGYGSGYASNWYYGGGGRGHNDRDKSWKEQGFTSGSHRPRDPYDPGYYRGTSYLYGRPSSTTTTQSPGSSAGGNAVTDNPQTSGNMS